LRLHVSQAIETLKAGRNDSVMARYTMTRVHRNTNGSLGQLKRVEADDLRFPMHDFIGYKIKRLSHEIMGEVDEIMRRYQLRVLDFGVLHVVNANPGIYQSGVASMLGVEPPAVVLASDRLESRGLISRKFDPNDRRVRALVITRAGEKLLPRIVEDLNEQDRKLRCTIQAKNLDTVESALDRLMKEYRIMK
jgi:DNA-binding MarR family transcriptional regulator